MKKEKKKRKTQSILAHFEFKKENKVLGKKSYTFFHNFKEFIDFCNDIPKNKRSVFKKITLDFVDGSFRKATKKEVEMYKKQQEKSKK